MKKMFSVLICSVAMMGCWGNSSVDNELVGQPKKIILQTPLVCHDRTDLDISMGVLRNGTGSVSSQDIDMTVSNPADAALLEQAIKEGKLVKVHYDTRRLTFCWNNDVITSVELLDK